MTVPATIAAIAVDLAALTPPTDPLFTYEHLDFLPDAAMDEVNDRSFLFGEPQPGDPLAITDDQSLAAYVVPMVLAISGAGLTVTEFNAKMALEAGLFRRWLETTRYPATSQGVWLAVPPEVERLDDGTGLIRFQISILVEEA